LRVDPTKAESCFYIFTKTRSVDIETAFPILSAKILRLLMPIQKDTNP